MIYLKGVEQMISIIIPVHNAEAYLEQCLESIINQTYKEFEAIIVNDHSTDNTIKICERFGALDNRILFINSENNGVSTARNLGIQCSRGTYIMFVDADDILNSNAVQAFINNMDSYDLVISSYIRIEQNQRFLHQHNDTDDFYSNVNDILEKSMIQSVWAKCFKREIIIKHKIYFKSHMSYGEDTDFLNRYIINTERIKIIKDITYFYNIHANSLSHRYIKNKYFIDCLLCKQLIEKCEGKVSQKSIEKIKNWYVCNSIRTYLISIIKNNNYQEYKRIVEKIYNDTFSINIIKLDTSSNKKWKLIRYMLLRKRFRGIYVIYKIKMDICLK